MEKTFELVSSKKERNGKGNASLNRHLANKAELREKNKNKKTLGSSFWRLIDDVPHPTISNTS